VPELHVLRVFTDAAGHHGNPLGVFLDGAAFPVAERQGVAAELGFSETVFVDEPARGILRIFTPAAELGLAGHPLVGTGWLLAHVGLTVDRLRPPAGEVPTWEDGELRWIRARPEWVHPINFERLADVASVEAAEPPEDLPSHYPWCWIDEPAGLVRSRFFPRELGIVEDEATGAAAIALTGLLGRPITIHQGRGSVLYGRPGPDGTVEIGGRVVLDDVRSYDRPT
jgi:predicted PhzF superfamily epimerase YddE/YHI9